MVWESRILQDLFADAIPPGQIYFFVHITLYIQSSVACEVNAQFFMQTFTICLGSPQHCLSHLFRREM